MQPVRAAFPRPRHVTVPVALLLDLEDIANVVDLGDGQMRELEMRGRTYMRATVLEAAQRDDEGTFFEVQELGFERIIDWQKRRSGVEAEELAKKIIQEDTHASHQTAHCSPERHQLDRKSTRLNSSHSGESRMPSSA